ncbi:MAG: uracil-DNA glycosylase [Miltoncostaeaceae bacterium]|jgi:uracil-DNA glycosylase family 4|nr:uracil-DNA glycosylase [Miltoncostaeaceae bacterium]
MTPDPPESRTTRRARSARPRGAAGIGGSPDQIQDAYLKRAIAEIGALNDEILGCERCGGEGTLPVMSSGSPQAQIMLVKWSASLAERQEGVAFFGRAGTAILKSVQRLGIDPLDLYGTLCVKCRHDDPEGAADPMPSWLSREIQIVLPKLVVPMGPQALDALNRLDFPLSEPLRAEPGAVQRFTPTIEAIYVPDIDESLDEQGAKRAFWAAFRAIGDWHEAQPPY